MKDTDSRFFSIVTQRPVAILMIAISMVVFGVVSYQRLSLTLMPKISYPRITLRTEFKGASAYEVESLVSKPIEQALGVLPNLTKITSVSYPGYSEVLCEFSWHVDIQEMIFEIREKLDRVRLPDGAETPLTLRYDPNLDPIMRLAVSGDIQVEELRWLATNVVKRELTGLKGVASVEVRGGSDPIVAIHLQKDRLTHYKITPQQIFDRLQNENINLAGGSLREGDVLYLVRILNEFKNLEGIENLIITYKNQAPIRLKHLAKVEESAREKEVISRIGGEEAVEILVYKEADTNLVEVANTIKKRSFGVKNPYGKKSRLGQKPVEKLLPSGVKLTVLSDGSTFVKKAIDEVRNAAVYGGILAVLVLLMFLNSFKNTIILGLAIPISLIVTFAPMNVVGISLNIMSLGGLALGAGMVVDNAIVVLESIFRKVEEGETMRDASVLGTGEVASAVTASTLTTVAVFFPIVFVEGIAGQIFTDQALTITFALVASLAVALFLIPTLAAFEVKGGKKRVGVIRQTLFTFHSVNKFGREWRHLAEKNKLLLVLALVWMVPKFLLFLVAEILGKIGFSILVIMLFAGSTGIWASGKVLHVVLWGPFRFFDFCLNRLRAGYSRVLAVALRLKIVVLAVAAVTIIWGGMALGNLGAKLLPDLYQGEFYQEIRMPPGTELSKTDAILTKVQAKLAPQKDIFQLISSRAGSEEDDLSGAGQEGGRLYVLLKTSGDLKSDEERAISLIRDELQAIPDVEILQVSKPQLFTFRTPIEVEIKGEDLEKLRRFAQALAGKLQNLDSLKNVRLSLKTGSPEIRVSLNRDKIAKLNLSAEQVANLIKSQFKGETPTFYRKRGERMDVVLQLREKDRKSKRDLEELNIAPQQDVAIPLKAVADIEVAEGPFEIRRIQQNRAVVISAELAGIDLQKAVSEIESQLDSVAPPEGVIVEMGGQYQEMLVSLRSLIFALLLATFLVYVVMASLFESFAQPFVIMFTLPFAFVGVIFTLYWWNLDLNVMVLIGVIMLAGIVVNNAIVLVDKINQLREEGMVLDEAIKLGGEIRFRPILMTTLTTVLGLLPMAIGWGEGAELRRSLAITVLAGLISSTVLTLLLIPLTYALWEGWRLRLVGPRREDGSDHDFTQEILVSDLMVHGPSPEDKDNDRPDMGVLESDEIDGLSNPDDLPDFFDGKEDDEKDKRDQ